MEHAGDAYGAVRERCPVARVDRGARRLLGCAGARRSRGSCGRPRHLQQRRPVLSHPQAAARVRPAGAHLLPAAAQSVLLARAPRRDGATPARLRRRAAGSADRRGARRSRGVVHLPVSDPGAVPAPRRPGRGLAPDQRLVEAGGRHRGPDCAREPGADRGRRGDPPVHDGAHPAAASGAGRRRRQRARSAGTPIFRRSTTRRSSAS